jgi:hypothetical protein
MDQARDVTATFILNTYPLTVSKGGNGTGSVSSNPAGIDCGTDCTQNYDYNTSVTLTATADASSTFTGWSGDTCTGTDPCQVAITQAREVTATFTLKQYTVTANATGTGAGTVSSDAGNISFTYPSGNSGTTTPLDHGSTITLTAAAASGSTAAWTGCTATGGTTSAATCTISSLASATTVSVAFTLNQYTVTAQANGNGSGAITSTPGEISFTYPAGSSGTTTPLNHGSAITLTATAASDSTVAWTGCAASGGTATVATCSFSSIDETKTVTAAFTLNQYRLSVLLEGTGKGLVTSEPAGINCGTECDMEYDCNQEVILTAEVDAGSKFKGWSGACTGKELTCTVTVDQALSVTAGFDNKFPWTMFLPAIMNIGK